MLNLLLFVVSCFIMHRCVLLVTHLDRHAWPQKWRFLLMALSIGLVPTGAFGISFGYAWGGWLLLFGIAGYFVFDRRQRVAS